MSTHALSNTLSETLFSKNRRAVSGLLYGHPDQAFYRGYGSCCDGYGFSERHTVCACYSRPVTP
jgi:hypothetical protein